MLYYIPSATAIKFCIHLLSVLLLRPHPSLQSIHLISFGNSLGIRIWCNYCQSCKSKCSRCFWKSLPYCRKEADMEIEHFPPSFGYCYIWTLSTMGSVILLPRAWEQSFRLKMVSGLSAHLLPDLIQQMNLFYLYMVLVKTGQHLQLFSALWKH